MFLKIYCGVSRYFSLASRHWKRFSKGSSTLLKSAFSFRFRQFLSLSRQDLAIFFRNFRNLAIFFRKMSEALTFFLDNIFEWFFHQKAQKESNFRFSRFLKFFEILTQNYSFSKKKIEEFAKNFKNRENRKKIWKNSKKKKRKKIFLTQIAWKTVFHGFLRQFFFFEFFWFFGEENSFWVTAHPMSN